MTLHQVVTPVRAVGGDVMAFGPTTFGFVILATLNGHSCRIISLKPGLTIQCVPTDPSSQTHIVSDLYALQSWLQSLSPQSALQAF